MIAKPLPVRWRLTLWYLAFLALALALFAVGFYVGLSRMLHGSLDTALRNQAAAMLTVIEVDDGRPQAAAEQLRRLLEDEQFIRLVDARGREVAAVSRDLDDDDDERPLRAGLTVAPNARTSLRWVDTGEDRVRVLTQPVVSEGRVVGVLQVGQSDEEMAQTLAFTRRLFLIAGPVVLVIAAFGGVWLAGRALTPVVRITQLAAEIEEHDLSRRIELALPNDEIGSLARTFNAMLDRIERAFHRQRQFTADAAHELRTPLALMQSQLELALRAAHRSADDQRVLEELHADVERLTRIAAALLMLARGDAKWIELSQDDIDLGALVDLVAEHYRPLARQAGVDLTVAAEPVSLVGDDDRLVQVLVNLLDNALRHTPPGKRVTVGCRPDGAQAQLWVADEGAGIAPEHLPHLFERFYRVEAGRNRHQGGIGLGLSITKLLVEQHGGSITISSTPEKGTIVMITLPYQPRSPNQVECRAGH